MLNLFGSNHSEIGSLSENLVLNTAGKIRIRCGSKFIDLLDNKGNIKSGNKVITSVSSESSMTSDGFYSFGGNLYVRINGVIIQITGNFVSYTNQIVTEEQAKMAQKNIGLTFESDEDALALINEGVVIVDGEIKSIKNGEISGYLNTVLKEINDSSLKEDVKSASDFKTLVKEKDEWKYVPILKITWQLYDPIENNETKVKSGATYYSYVPYGSSALPPVRIRSEYKFTDYEYDYEYINPDDTSKGKDIFWKETLDPITKDTVIRCAGSKELLKKVILDEADDI